MRAMLLPFGHNPPGKGVPADGSRANVSDRENSRMQRFPKEAMESAPMNMPANALSERRR